MYIKLQLVKESHLKDQKFNYNSYAIDNQVIDSVFIFIN